MPLEWAPRAHKDLRRIHPEEARRITEAVHRYFDTAHGDVRYLKGSEQLFRLRVGDYRVVRPKLSPLTVLLPRRGRPRSKDQDLVRPRSPDPTRLRPAILIDGEHGIVMEAHAEERELRNQADLLRTLAHPTRLAILRQLVDGPRCVTDLQELVDVSQSNASQHLTALRRHELIDYHKSGTLRCYYLARPALVEGLLDLLDQDSPPVHPDPDTVRRAALERSDSEGGAATPAASG